MQEGEKQQRMQMFEEQKLKQGFGDMHVKVMGDEIATHGYPDCGSGRYT